MHLRAMVPACGVSMSVDRGIDNNEDPNIIDGKMYEMTAPMRTYGNTQPIVKFLDLTKQYQLTTVYFIWKCE